MAFTGNPTGQVNTLPIYGQAQSQTGNYGNNLPGFPNLPISQALAQGYLDTLRRTRPKRRMPTLPMAFMYGYLDNGGY